MGSTDTAGMDQALTERAVWDFIAAGQSVSWAAWLLDLGLLGFGHDERFRAIKTTEIATWRGYYEQSYAPDVALVEVMTPGGWPSLLGK